MSVKVISANKRCCEILKQKNNNNNNSGNVRDFNAKKESYKCKQPHHKEVSIMPNINNVIDLLDEDELDFYNSLVITQNNGKKTHPTCQIDSVLKFSEN